MRRAYVFGSTAWGEANDQSDVDVLVELDHDATLFDQARMFMATTGPLTA